MSFRLDSGAIPHVDEVLEPLYYLCVTLGRRGSIRLLRELSGGYTGARVFLAEEQVGPDDPRPFQLVFKVGPSRFLREEVERYQALRVHARAHKAFAQILEPERTLDSLSDSDSAGAIAYEHAAASFAREDCVPLKDLVAQAIRGEAQLEGVAEILATTVQAIGSLYASPKADFAFELAKYYLDRWVPHFRLAIEDAVEVEGQYLLTHRRLNPAQFRSEPTTPAPRLRQAAESPTDAQTDLVVPRLSLVRTTEAGIIVHGPTSDALSLELDLRALSSEARRKIASSRTVALWTSAPADSSRYDFYLRRLQEAFPSRDLGRSILAIGGQHYHNPLRHFSRPLLERTRPPARTRLVPAHGDLHPGNVLVVGSMPVIIDYGLAEAPTPCGNRLRPPVRRHRPGRSLRDPPTGGTRRRATGAPGP